MNCFVRAALLPLFLALLVPSPALAAKVGFKIAVVEVPNPKLPPLRRVALAPAVAVQRDSFPGISTSKLAEWLSEHKADVVHPGNWDYHVRRGPYEPLDIVGPDAVTEILSVLSQDRDRSGDRLWPPGLQPRVDQGNYKQILPLVADRLKVDAVVLPLVGMTYGWVQLVDSQCLQIDSWVKYMLVARDGQVLTVWEHRGKYIPDDHRDLARAIYDDMAREFCDLWLPEWRRVNLELQCTGSTKDGCTHAEEGHWADAFRSWETRVEVKPDDVEALYDMGVAYEYFDQPARALALYERAAAVKSKGFVKKAIERAGRRMAEVEWLAGSGYVQGFPPLSTEDIEELARREAERAAQVAAERARREREEAERRAAAEAAAREAAELAETGERPPNTFREDVTVGYAYLRDDAGRDALTELLEPLGGTVKSFRWEGLAGQPLAAGDLAGLDVLLVGYDTPWPDPGRTGTGRDEVVTAIQERQLPVIDLGDGGLLRRIGDPAWTPPSLPGIGTPSLHLPTGAGEVLDRLFLIPRPVSGVLPLADADLPMTCRDLGTEKGEVPVEALGRPPQRLDWRTWCLVRSGVGTWFPIGVAVSDLTEEGRRLVANLIDLAIFGPAPAPSTIGPDWEVDPEALVMTSDVPLRLTRTEVDQPSLQRVAWSDAGTKLLVRSQGRISQLDVAEGGDSWIGEPWNRLARPAWDFCQAGEVGAWAHGSNPIVVIDARGGERQLQLPSGICEVRRLVLSADCGMVAIEDGTRTFVSSLGGASWQARDCIDPALAPDGSSLVCAVRDEADRFALVRYEGDSHEVLVEGGNNTLPVFAPDGRQVAFVRNTLYGESGSVALQLIQLDSGEQQVLLETPLVARSAPSWSPDGSRLGFAIGGRLAVLFFGGHDQLFTWQASEEIGLWGERGSLPGIEVGALVASPEEIGLLVAARTDGTVAVSTDGGRSWEEAEALDTDEAPLDMYWVQGDPSAILALAVDGTLWWRSMGGGVWQQVAAGLGRVHDVTVDGSTVVAATEAGLLRSTDQGQSWGRVGRERAIRRVSRTSRGLLSTTDKGIVLTSADADSWDVVLPWNRYPEWRTEGATAVESGGGYWVSLGSHGVAFGASGGNWQLSNSGLPVGSRLGGASFEAVRLRVLGDGSVVLSTGRGRLYRWEPEAKRWYREHHGLADEGSPGVSAMAEGPGGRRYVITRAQQDEQEQTVFAWRKIDEQKTLTGQGYFDTGSAKPKPDLLTQLDGIRGQMEGDPALVLRVEGHTDDVGDEAYNQDLSRRRASAVAGWLGSKGLDASRVTVAGYGELRPLAPNFDEPGRAENRRVELFLTRDVLEDG